MYFTVLLLKISTVWKWIKFWELELVPDLTAFRWNNVRLTVSRTCLQSEAMKIHFKHPQKSNKGYDWPSPYSLQLTVCSITTNRNPLPNSYEDYSDKCSWKSSTWSSSRDLGHSSGHELLPLWLHDRWMAITAERQQELVRLDKHTSILIKNRLHHFMSLLQSKLMGFPSSCLSCYL